jgi:Zn-finger nucleic acid-binding protein
MEPYRGVSATTSPGPCPRCPTSQLEIKDAGDVRIGDCATCAGAWLDGPGLLDLLIASPRTLGRLAGSDEEVRDRHEPAPCPQCKATMRVETGTSGVRYDVCEEHGVWFDAGELSAVLRHAGISAKDAESRVDEPFARVVERMARRDGSWFGRLV